MKNKKIIIVLVILIICAICFGIFKARYNEQYLYNQNGKIIDGRSELINHLKNIEDENERKKQVDFSVQQNIITQEEANELY